MTVQPGIAGSLVDALESEQRLLRAWEDVFDAATDDGLPGPEGQAFADSAATRIAELAGRFRDRTWEPSPVVHLPIPKSEEDSADWPSRRSPTGWLNVPCSACWTR